MKTLQAVLLKLVIWAAASGMPSTCEVLSAVTSAATEAPHAAVIAEPTARTGGWVMIPWERTICVKAEAARRMEYDIAIS